MLFAAYNIVANCLAVRPSLSPTDRCFTVGGGWARMGGEGTISPRPYASRSATIFMLKTTRIPSEKSGSTSHDVITCIIFLPSNVHSCSDQVGYMKVTSTLWCVKLYTLLGSALVQNSRCHHHNHDALLSVQK